MEDSAPAPQPPSTTSTPSAKTYTCHYCDPSLVFMKEGERKVHHRITHQASSMINHPLTGEPYECFRNTSSGNFNCPRCIDHTDRDPVRLKRHVLSCSSAWPEKTYPCEECEGSIELGSANNLKDHHRIVHQKTAPINHPSGCMLEISRNQETSTFTCPRCSNYDTPDPNRLTWHCTTSCTSLFPPLSDFQPPVTVPPPSAFKSPKVVLKSPGAHSDQEPNSVAVPTAASSTSPLPPANGPKETPGSTTPLTVVKQKQKRFYCRLCTPQLSFENAEIKEAHVQAFHADLKKKKRRATTAADAGSGLKNEIGEGEGPGPSAKTRRRTRGSEVGPDALFAGGADSPGLMLPPPSTLSPRTRSGWAASYLPTSQNPYGGYPASMLANRDYPQSSPYNHSLNAPYGDPALHGYSPSLPPPPQPTQSGRRRTMVPTDHRPSCQFCIVFPPVRFDSPQGKEEHEERVHSWPKKRKAFVLSPEQTEEGNGEGETMVVEKEETVKADPGECLECIPNVKFGNQTHQAWHWRVCHSKEITVMFGDGEQALISRSTKSGRFDCPGCSHPGSQKTGYRNWDPESLKKHLEVCLPSSSTTVSPPPVLSPSTVPPPPAVPSSNLPTTAISADSALMEGVEPTDHTSPSKTQLPSSLPLETPPLPTVPIPEEPGSAKALGPSHSASKYSLSSLLNN